jgi:hypothetical protein
VHLKLPVYAQKSREVLQRFVKTIPPNTPIWVTTMNLFGKPRQSSMLVSDLRPVSQRFGMINYERDRPTRAPRWYHWFMMPPATKFNIPPRVGSAREDWVWTEIADIIAKRSKGKGR